MEPTPSISSTQGKETSLGEFGKKRTKINNNSSRKDTNINNDDYRNINIATFRLSFSRLQSNYLSDSQKSTERH